MLGKHVGDDNKNDRERSEDNGFDGAKKTKNLVLGRGVCVLRASRSYLEKLCLDITTTFAWVVSVTMVMCGGFQRDIDRRREVRGSGPILSGYGGFSGGPGLLWSGKHRLCWPKLFPNSRIHHLDYWYLDHHHLLVKILTVADLRAGLSVGEFLATINDTLITLILKVSKPEHINEFRAISLCRLISDNAIIWFECLHSFRTRVLNDGSFALKLNMAKTYDPME
ncbi:hypothetical protein Dsin_002578 [Dipteronia sinensis]|uniref:Uncharacterized protein n=1 Tax=Dipteronia sinensis TaxID=43782 RepID=A0AAE0B7C9_9ROSI|nr:hypothetical protein Dsin_002578 [Dipteronia sinensis]